MNHFVQWLKQASLRSRLMLALFAALVFAILALALWEGRHIARANGHFSESYPYGSEQLDAFIRNSYAETGRPYYKEFYAWMNESYKNWRDYALQEQTFPFPGAEKLGFMEMCEWARRGIESRGEGASREKEEIKLASGVHTIIKGIITRFSLQRGYEFANVVQYGERQCFLQSVLIASILQSAAMEAGVIMVYKNERGEESNNGHAVVLVRLNGNEDVLVDASEPTPFAHHQGLFCNSADGTVYVEPFYDNSGIFITSYTRASGAGTMARNEIKCQDLPFLESMFDVYRGEWVAGGFHDGAKSKDGMNQAGRYFLRGIKLCPENPLAVYFYGRVQEELKDKDLASAYFLQAQRLYQKSGWVPEGLKERLRKFDLPVSPAPAKAR
jgi:hypothetical protein